MLVLGEDGVDENEGILSHQLVIVVHVHDKIVRFAISFGIFVLLTVIGIGDVLDYSDPLFIQRVGLQVLVDLLASFIIVQIVNFSLRVVLSQ